VAGWRAAQDRLTAEVLAALFEEGWSAAEVADVYGCTARTVRNVAHRHGVVLPRTQRAVRRAELLGDSAWLRAALAAGRSPTELARELGGAAFEVTAALSAAGLSYVAPRHQRFAQLHEPGWLQARVDAGATVAAIAAEAGCGRSTVQRAARAMRVVRPRWPKYPQLADGRWLRARYVTARRSIASIAAELGADERTIARALRRAGIHARRPGGSHRPAGRGRNAAAGGRVN
jgi:predicted transcriptional regulator